MMIRTRKEQQRGSVFAYILGAIMVLGALVVAVSSGARKNALTVQIDSLTTTLKADITLAEGAVQDCALQYPAAADVDGDGDIDATDNPNPPFPVYGNLSTGGTGDDLEDVRCPGAPGAPPLFKTTAGVRTIRITEDADYTATYINNSTEGAVLRVSRGRASPVWTEAISRVDSDLSACKATAETIADGNCDYGCLYFWFMRRTATSPAHGEGGCP
ncbi:MAG: hypothetical protein OXT65_09845 [Alphaproteobacteria bacterium]|nr:hypothetical protein [Alphaproteobacteria bacterium]